MIVSFSFVGISDYWLYWPCFESYVLFNFFVN